MQIIDFLSAVLPPHGNGFYCTAEFTSRKKEHIFVETLQELADAGAKLDRSGRDAYFALSTYATGDSRTAANAVNIRSLFADLDVGDSGTKYSDIKSAVAGIGAWCDSTGLPIPILVKSGYGVHCYWPLAQAVSIDTWRPVAEAFKRAATALGLRIDYSVSADAARVLRIPGSRNRKRVESATRSVHGEDISGVEVVIKTVSDGNEQPLSIEDYARLLEPYAEKKKALVKIESVVDGLGEVPKYATEKQSVKTDLDAITQNRFDPIVGPGGCKQIAHYCAHAADEGMEPLWRACISVAIECVDGLALCRELSALHPYDEDRMQSKLGSIKGPYKCVKFAEQSAGICDGCEHQGKITSPIQLGKELKPQAAATASLSTGTTVETQDFPTPPRGYALSARGVAAQMRDAEGVIHTAIIADTPFYATATYDREGERYVQFTYIEHTVAKSTVMSLVSVTGKDEPIKAFSKIGIIVPTGQDAAFRSYLKATVAQAKEKPPMRMPTSLGWQPDGTFAYDSRVFSATGEHIVPMHGFDNINSTIGVRGTLEGWKMVIAHIQQRERYDIISMMLIGFAAPLIKFTGLNGVTFHICSNDSGKGKTVCQRLASSVWGQPNAFRTTAGTSSLAMINRLGLLGNLPLLVDEITHVGRKDLEWFPEFLSQMSDGRGKDRMEASSNAERRNTTTWASMALMTSNKHMLDYLTAERQHGSEGEIRRLIELVFNKPFEMDALSIAIIVDQLNENYGSAGEAFARYIVRNADVARSITKTAYTELFSHFGSTGDERYWIAGCASIVAAARLLGRAYADIITLPIKPIISVLLDTVKRMREETGKSKRTATDVLNAFTKACYGKLVMVNDKIAHISGIEVAETLDRKDLCGRVERNVKAGTIDYYIEEKELKSFCSSLSYGYAEFKEDLKKEGIALDYIRKDLLSGTKGPLMSVRCIRISQNMHEAPQELKEELAANDA